MSFCYTITNLSVLLARFISSSLSPLTCARVPFHNDCKDMRNDSMGFIDFNIHSGSGSMVIRDNKKGRLGIIRVEDCGGLNQA